MDPPEGLKVLGESSVDDDSDCCEEELERRCEFLVGGKCKQQSIQTTEHGNCTHNVIYTESM